MRPILKSGQQVLVKPGERIRSGDCICYRVEDKHFIHRVTSVKGGMYRISSDSASIEHHWIPSSFIIGKVMDKKAFLNGKIGLLYFYTVYPAFSLGKILKKHIIPNIRRRGS